MFQQYKINYIISLYKLKINTGFSFLSGNYHSSYLINKGALYTDINGNYLDLNYDLYSISTHLSDNIFERNGNGLALEFLFKYTIKDYKFNIYIEDLGFIMWNPESISTSSDSNFTFNGIQVENILNFNDSILEQYNNIDNIIKQENTSFKTYTPANFGVSIQRKTQHSIFQKISAGINIKWQPHYEISNTSFWDLRRKIRQGIDESNYTPLIWASNIYKYKDLNIISNLSYGGYTGKTNIGLAVSKGNKKKVIIGGNNLQEILDINNIKAIGIHFSFLIHL